jgi:hypothetical protein
MEDSKRRNDVLLAMQQALLGEVTPNLRAVTVAYDESDIHFCCFYDGVASETDRENMSCVETELIAHFPESHTVSHEVRELDRFQPISGPGIWVFARKES